MVVVVVVSGGVSDTGVKTEFDAICMATSLGAGAGAGAGAGTGAGVGIGAGTASSSA